MIPENETWSHGLKKKAFPPLKGETEADVVIIGGGLAGALSAYVLAQAGKNVVILEKNAIGSGVTRLTTAFLTQSIDTDFTDLIKTFGKKAAKDIIHSHGEAIKLIKKISKTCGIACDFTDCSNYVYALSKKDVPSLEDEARAAKELGLSARFIKDGSGLHFKNEGFLEIKNQAKFHPLKFLYGLSEKLAGLGVSIYEHTEVTSLKSDGKTVTVETKKGIVTARKAIVATYEPFNQPWKLYFKKGLYVSYVLDLEVEGLSLREGTYEDMENPYHYMRVDKDAKKNSVQRVLIGGEDHRKDIPVSKAKNFNALQSYLDRIFAKASYTIKAKWTGPILEPVDGLAVIGPSDDKNIFYAMAFSGNGMTYSGITALMARDFALGKKNLWEKYYSSRRIPTVKSLLTKGRDYGVEFMKGALKNTFAEDKSPLVARRQKRKLK